MVMVLTAPSPRRGRGRRRERDGPRNASPSLRHGRERLLEIYGPRDASPIARRGRHRRRERDAPRTISSASHRRSKRRGERGGARGADPAAFRDHEHHNCSWPTAHPSHDRPRTAPPSSHSGRDLHPEHDGPRSSSPTSDHGHALQQEREGPRPPSSTEKRRRDDDDGAAPLTSHSGQVEQKGVGEEDAPDATPPTPPVAQSRSDEECTLALPQTADVGPMDDKEASSTITFNAGDDVLGEIISWLHPTELARMMCGRHIHKLISRIINPVTPEMQTPFLGAIVQRGKSQDLVTLIDRRLLREIRGSVAYFRGSLKQLTDDSHIIDCRSGLMALRFGKQENKFCICSPFQRKSWILLPQFRIQTDHVLGGALITDCNYGFSLLLLCVDKSVEGDTFPLVVNIFRSNTRRWDRIVQSLHLKEAETVLPHGVYCNGSIYFLSKKRGEILKVDPTHFTIDLIPLPQQVFPQMVLTRVGEQMCFATAGNRRIFIFQHNNNQWVRRWLRHTPPEAYWTKLIGAAEENGVLIVETGSDQMHALKSRRWIMVMSRAT